MDESITTFENEHISLQVDRLPNCFVKLLITTKPLATQAAKAKALKDISKEVNIPGFRKGKAPLQLIEKQFAPTLEKETKDIILRNALNEAVQLCKIQPYSDKNGVKLIKFDPVNDQSYEIVIEFEAFPEIPEIKIEDLQVEPPETKEVTDADVENKLEELCIYHSTWTEVEDRPAIENDFVTIDFDVIDENPFTVYRDSRFHLKDTKIPSWAKNLLIGQSKGAVVEGFSEPEEEHTGEFTSRNCRITLKKIETAVLPPIDDALAQKAGVDTVDTLRKNIRAHLEREETQKAKNSLRKQIKKELAAKHMFAIPQSRINALAEECKESSSEEHFRNEDDKKRYEEKMMEEGIQTIRVSFLLPKLINEHKLPKPSSEKLRERVMSYMIPRYMEKGKSIDPKEVEYVTAVAENDLIVEEALDYLIEKITKNS